MKEKKAAGGPAQFKEKQRPGKTGPAPLRGSGCNVPFLKHGCLVGKWIPAGAEGASLPSGAVRMKCRNEECPAVPWIHVQCYDELCDLLSDECLRSHSRCTNWSKKFAMDNLWRQGRGYDLIYSLCKCPHPDCNGILRRDDEFDPATKPAPPKTAKAPPPPKPTAAPMTKAQAKRSRPDLNKLLRPHGNNILSKGGTGKGISASHVVGGMDALASKMRYSATRHLTRRDSKMSQWEDWDEEEEEKVQEPELEVSRFPSARPAPAPFVNVWATDKKSQPPSTPPYKSPSPAFPDSPPTGLSYFPRLAFKDTLPPVAVTASRSASRSLAESFKAVTMTAEVKQVPVPAPPLPRPQQTPKPMEFVWKTTATGWEGQKFVTNLVSLVAEEKAQWVWEADARVEERFGECSVMLMDEMATAGGLGSWLEAVEAPVEEKNGRLWLSGRAAARIPPKRPELRSTGVVQRKLEPVGGPLLAVIVFCEAYAARLVIESDLADGLAMSSFETGDWISFVADQVLGRGRRC